MSWFAFTREHRSHSDRKIPAGKAEEAVWVTAAVPTVLPWLLGDLDRIAHSRAEHHNGAGNTTRCAAASVHPAK